MSQITVNKIQGLTTGGNANTIVLNTNSTDVLTINSSGNVNIANSLTIGHDETISLGNNGVIGSPDDPYFATSEGGSGHGFKINGALASIYPSTATGGGQNDTTDLGYSTAKWRNLYLSGGVYLGGTGSTNLLDDYEEGIYNPTLTPTSGTVAVNSSFNELSYTKIGRVVHITGVLTNVQPSSASGDLNISIPFTTPDQTKRSAWGGGLVTLTETTQTQTNYNSGQISLAYIFVENSSFITVGNGADYLSTSNISDLRLSFTIMAS